MICEADNIPHKSQNKRELCGNCKSFWAQLVESLVKFYHFAVLSLVSSSNSSMEPTRERPLYVSSLRLTPLFLSFSPCFAQRGNPSIWIPRGKAQTLSRQIIVNTVTGRRQGVIKPSALSHDGEPTIVRWALVRVCRSVFPCTLTLPSSWYRFICLSWEERLSSRPAGWIPDQADFPLVLCFYSRVIADIRNIREVTAEQPCSADYKSAKHREADLAFPSQTSPLPPVGHSPCHIG